jgi:hypothetical protein
MRSAQELLQALLNDEKILSVKAPIEALGPEMSENAIKVLKQAGIRTVGEFQDMEINQVHALSCRRPIFKEILRYWHDLQEEKRLSAE